MREIARMLDIHHSTVSREVKRNPSLRNNQVTGYHASDAHRKSKTRRLAANQRFRKITPGSELERIVIEKVSVLFWAPEQIAGWLKITRKNLYVCAQTIYDWIYTYRDGLVQYLHCRKGKYRRTRQAKVRKQKRAGLSVPRNISKRPKHIEKRKTYGHWEGDTVHGSGKSGYMATFVERKSGYLTAKVLTPEQYNSIGFADATEICLKDMPTKYRKTLTLDNGPEMKAPERIERTTGAKVYYANPYHSWERGTNENTNGLLRYFFPKKSSFKDLTQEQLDEAVYLINTRPRKRLNWRTPEQMLKT